MIEMMANLSHDVRTPLAAIKGYGETLLQGGLEDAENRLDFVRTIMKHADRLSFLVEDMLLLTDLDSRAKNPSFVFQTVDLAGVVEKYVKSLSPETTPLAIDVPAALMVRADAEHLTRVFQNLIDNAVKYNRPGGSVRVEARADGASAVVTVRDTGRGIPRPELDRIFGRFYRGRATKHLHGTGLGLAIVKSIVELHGGRIWVESVFRKGSAFHFTLPLAG
jgi:two-component system phosphate regulon sensor histidine kinase PhoR